jgi:hypothetical protein
LINENLIGRCGLYCGACSIYRAYKDNGEYLKTLAENFKCPPEKVQCQGCLALTTESWGYDCKIVQCLRSKGLDFCYQCRSFECKTCEKYEKLEEGYMEDGEDIRANLDRIKNGEADVWLQESEQAYRCPASKKPLPVGRMKRKCYHCGTDLSEKD